MSRDRTLPLRKRIAQLEAELRAVRWQTEDQCQRIAQKYGREFVALIDGDPNTRVTATDMSKGSYSRMKQAILFRKLMPHWWGRLFR